MPFLHPFTNKLPRQANRYQNIEKQRGYARKQVLEAMCRASLSELSTHNPNDVAHVTTAASNCQQQFSDPIRLFCGWNDRRSNELIKELEDTDR